MALLTGIFFLLVSFVIGVIQNLLASDIYDRCPRIALWLLSRAVATVPEDQRDRYREEWSADLLTDCPTKLDQVRVALEVLWGARKIAREASVPPKLILNMEVQMIACALIFVGASTECVFEALHGAPWFVVGPSAFMSLTSAFTFCLALYVRKKQGSIVEV